MITGRSQINEKQLCLTRSRGYGTGARQAAPKILSWGKYVPLARCKEVCMPPERCADGARGARHPRVVYSNLFFACHRLFHSCMPNRPVLVQRIIVVQLCRHYGAYFEERALSQSERCTFSKNLHFSSPQLTATFFLYKGKCTGASTSHIFAEQALKHCTSCRISAVHPLRFEGELWTIASDRTTLRVSQCKCAILTL